MQHNIYIYILVMFAVTYLIRVLPLTLIRKEIKNKTIRSFLYYVPYVTLAVMTFPAIMEADSAKFVLSANNRLLGKICSEPAIYVYISQSVPTYNLIIPKNTFFHLHSEVSVTTTVMHVT